MYYQDENVTLWHGDCLDIIPELPTASVDAVVTDPPYELAFMGRKWDSSGIAFNVALWQRCLRVLKPGGHILAFGGSRTWHRLGAAIEDAGFEIRDSIAWLYGSGFPKSLNIQRCRARHDGSGQCIRPAAHQSPCRFARSSEQTDQWQSWSTALKPAFEPIVVARKPLVGTVSANVTEHGTGALNIDACRVAGQPRTTHAAGNCRTRSSGPTYNEGFTPHGPLPPPSGRWPANVLLDGSQADALDEQGPHTKDGVAIQRNGGGQALFGGIGSGENTIGKRADQGFSGSGGPSRFFPTFRYTAKASTTERPTDDGVAHPTVKPVELVRWLIRLVTPPGGTVLDPFAGSGTTGEAAIHEHKHAILIEREPSYLPLIVARLSKPMAVGFDFGE